MPTIINKFDRSSYGDRILRLEFDVDSIKSNNSALLENSKQLEVNVEYLSDKVVEMDKSITLLSARVDTCISSIENLDKKFDYMFEEANRKILDNSMKIDSLDRKIDSLENKFELKFDSLESRLDSKIDSLKYWFIGIIVSIILCAVSVYLSTKFDIGF
ncbi:MAG: hypothetical protein LBD17_00245 [Endomicrobium sp.]|jgi:predicted RNase H-like nuclease (RuvC/YqgF family)|nr:hypothetical protein [Endomicrobium sp.]